MRWMLWLGFAAAWTTALVIPIPSDQLQLGELFISRRVLVAKTVHVAAYAVFTILTGWLRVPLRWRPALMFLLMAHAAGTEFIQLNLSYRSGTVGDVLFNHLGIAVGFAMSWAWWTRECAVIFASAKPPSEQWGSVSAG